MHAEYQESIAACQDHVCTYVCQEETTSNREVGETKGESCFCLQGYKLHAAGSYDHRTFYDCDNTQMDLNESEHMYMHVG